MVLPSEDAAKVTAQHFANAAQYVKIETKFKGDGRESANVQPVIIHLSEDDIDSDSDLSAIEPFNMCKSAPYSPVPPSALSDNVEGEIRLSTGVLIAAGSSNSFRQHRRRDVLFVCFVQSHLWS